MKLLFKEKKSAQGRGLETKTLVDVAAECIGKQIDRVRFKCIPEASGKTSFVIY